MDFKKHLEIAWTLMLKNIVALILMTLVLFGLSLITLGILAPVMTAGYVQSVLRMVRNGKEPAIGDLFSQMGLFVPLLIFSVVVFIATLVGFSLFFLPGLIVVIAVTFGCLYMLPLMTDEKMGLIEAVKSSWNMALQEKVTDHVVVVILFIALMAVGGSVFIGTLFTQPFATIFIMSVFLERRGIAAQATARPPVPPPSAGNGGDAAS